MAIRIPREQIQNLQQIEVTVAGPEGANRMFTIVGQFDPKFTSGVAVGGNALERRETFTVLVGPTLTRQQFLRAISTASVTGNVGFLRTAALVEQSFGWGITGSDADWDDESQQVELRIEVFATVTGIDNTVSIGGLAFQVMIVAAVTAA